MHERRFCQWTPWSERKAIADSGYPGVYVIARSMQDISGTRFKWLDRIIYVGMTNAISGLSGRLKQFDVTVRGRTTRHGGADRVRFKHQNYERLASSLFVAVAPFKCDPSSHLPGDLRKMGEVAKFEFACLAEYAERFDRLPQFNDKRKSPKYSKVAK
jgi:hypothetical protein